MAVVWALFYAWGRRNSTLHAHDLMAPQFPEPSGIVYHPGRDSLFIVGDEGHVAELSTTGRILQNGILPKANFEGITVVPNTGLLYALLEEENAIVEIDPNDLSFGRRFEIDGRYGSDDLIPQGADGLEGIAFVLDAGHKLGGRFFIVNRGPVSPSGKAEAGHSFLAELDVPLNAPSSEKKSVIKIAGAVPVEIGDLSGLMMRRNIDNSDQTPILVAISCKGKMRLALDRQGRVRTKAEIPGPDPEGITLTPSGRLYIAYDSGGVLVMEYAWPANVLKRSEW